VAFSCVVCIGVDASRFSSDDVSLAAASSADGFMERSNVFSLDEIELPRSKARVDHHEHQVALSSCLASDDEEINNADQLISKDPFRIHSQRERLERDTIRSFLDLEQRSPTVSNNKQQQTLQFTKTGTTIAGVCGADFVVLAADTRATSGRIVADKQAAKIHAIAANIYACGAGTSADLEFTTRRAYYTIKARRALECSIGNDETPANDSADESINVAYACQFLEEYLFEQKGSCQAYLIVGGVYKEKPLLRAIHPHGSTDEVSYTAMGSGSLAAMAMLEDQYRPNVSVDEAVQLAVRAITAGIENDLGSGSQVDVCIIRKDSSVTYTRAAVPEETLPTVRGVVPELTAEKNLSTPGVNGFGNVPYAIKSKRQIKVYGKDQENKKWEEFLGLR
jgi:20S proteasome subunit beta 2